MADNRDTPDTLADRLDRMATRIDMQGARGRALRAGATAIRETATIRDALHTACEERDIHKRHAEQAQRELDALRAWIRQPPPPGAPAGARELAESWINGNRSTVVGVIHGLPPREAALVAAYVAHYLPPDDVGPFLRALER